MFKKKDNVVFKFKLGDRVRDTITGFIGIIISRCEWLHNCTTYGVKSEKLKDGKPLDCVHFDGPELVLVKEKVIEENNSTGGSTEPVLRTNR